MANNVGITIEIKGLEARIENILVDTEEQLREIWEVAAQECVTEIANNAPDPDVEYDLVMRGGNGVDLIPRDGDMSAIGDPPRVRFIRAPGKWLKQLVADPSVNYIDAGNFVIHLGILGKLIEGSRFSWINANKKGQQTIHVLEEGTFVPLEYGGTVEVHATNAIKLAPDDNREHRTSSMIKHFPGFKIYQRFDPGVVVRAIQSRLKF